MEEPHLGHQPVLSSGVCLIPYSITLMYEPGHRNPADYILQHPNYVPDTDCSATKIAEDYIQFITNSN